MQRAGEPDLDGAIILHGRLLHFKIELKVDDNQPSKLQAKRLAMYRRLGYITGTAWSLLQFTEMLMDASQDESLPVWSPKNEGNG